MLMHRESDASSLFGNQANTLANAHLQGSLSCQHVKWRKLEFQELSARSVSPCVLLPHKEQRCDFRPMTNERPGHRTTKCGGSSAEQLGRSLKRRHSCHSQHALVVSSG